LSGRSTGVGHSGSASGSGNTSAPRSGAATGGLVAGPAAKGSTGQAAKDSTGQAAEAPAGQPGKSKTRPAGDANLGTTAPTAAASVPGTPASTAASTGGAAASSGSPASAPTAAPVPAQLQPSLARLVSRGDGTHRMSLRLHPAALGEVRLTVTVKDGTVDVALAAGPQAQDALRQGSAQLRAMLGSSGHTLGQLVVQSLPASASTGGPGTGGAGQQGAGQQPGQGSPQGSAQGSPQGSAHGSGHQQAFGQPGQHTGQHQPGRDWAGGSPVGPGPGRAPVVPPDRAADPRAARGPRTGIDVRI
jgi:flagellar hook-length control protein FliK